MRYPAILIAVLLSACASPGDLLQRDPQLLFTSESPAEKVAACIADAWSQRMGNISHIPTPNGYRVIIQHPNAGADAVADVSRSGSGSTVRYIERLPAMMPGWSMECVSACR